MDRLARLLLRSDWPGPVVCAFAHINPHMAMYDGQAVYVAGLVDFLDNLEGE